MFSKLGVFGSKQPVQSVPQKKVQRSDLFVAQDKVRYLKSKVAVGYGNRIDIAAAEINTAICTPSKTTPSQTEAAIKSLNIIWGDYVAEEKRRGQSTQQTKPVEPANFWHTISCGIFI